MKIVTADATIQIPMDELVDRAAELARLSKERESVQKQLDGAQARLNNPAFTSKAPEAVVGHRPRERGAAGGKAGPPGPDYRELSVK